MISLLPSFRRQLLLLDAAALQDTCPRGIYIAVSPEDPSRWSGVFFVHKGPYEPAILRFSITFPSAYPDAAPLIVFSSEIFHPLCVPSTVYTFSAGEIDPSGTVSASDDERLPPGSFSLRHAFPIWYGKQRNARTSSGSDAQTLSVDSTDAGMDASRPLRSNSQCATFKVLHHLKEAIEDEAVLDSIPLRAAGNPSAWHAWRAYRGLAQMQDRGRSPEGRNLTTVASSPRQPSTWKWDGVWESRVHEGIEMSTTEAALFNANEGLRFTRLDDEQYATAKEEALDTV